MGSCNGRIGVCCGTPTWNTYQEDGSLPFLDTKVTSGPNNTLATTVYRKQTHTDQYLHWDSNHFIAAKHSIYNTLAHRTKVVSSNQPFLIKELDHIKMALQSCHFPTLALNKLQHNFEHRHYINNESSSTDSQPNNNHNNSGTSHNNKKKNLFIVVPYIQGLGEKFKRTCNKKGIQVHFKGSNTIKTLLMDKDTKLQKCGVIQKYKCPQINCPEEYGVHCRDWQSIWGQAERTPQGPIPQHTSSTGHPTSQECFSIVHRDAQGTGRNIKEAMFIWANDPSLNSNLGKYQLSHVWDQILQDTPALKLK